jgi:Ni/Co efflux regulator RcnB
MKRVAGILAILSVLGGSAAMADPHFDRDHGRDGASEHRDGQREGRWSQGDHRGPPREVYHNDDRFYRADHRRIERERYDDHYGRFDDRYVRPQERADFWRGDRPPAVYYERPYGRYDFRRGDRLPVAYYGRAYVIDDYRDCGLYAPPRGYRWVRVDSNAVLAAVATGIVLDAVYHAF